MLCKIYANNSTSFRPKFSDLKIKVRTSVALFLLVQRQQCTAKAVNSLVTLDTWFLIWQMC